MIFGKIFPPNLQIYPPQIFYTLNTTILYTPFE